MRVSIIIAAVFLVMSLSSVRGAYYNLWLDSTCSTSFDDSVSFPAPLTSLYAASEGVIATKVYSTFNSTGIAWCTYAQGSTTQFVFSETTWANQTGVYVFSASGVTSPAGGPVPLSYLNTTLLNTSLPVFALLNGTAPIGACSPIQFCEGRFAGSNTSFLGAPYNLPCNVSYIQVDCTAAVAPTTSSSSSSAGSLSSVSASSSSVSAVSSSSVPAVSSSSVSSVSSSSAAVLSSISAVSSSSTNSTGQSSSSGTSFNTSSSTGNGAATQYSVANAALSLAIAILTLTIA